MSENKILLTNDRPYIEFRYEDKHFILKNIGWVDAVNTTIIVKPSTEDIRKEYSSIDVSVGIERKLPFNLAKNKRNNCSVVILYINLLNHKYYCQGYEIISQDNGVSQILRATDRKLISYVQFYNINRDIYQGRSYDETFNAFINLTFK